jgi:hypothetical protein
MMWILQSRVSRIQRDGDDRNVTIAITSRNNGISVSIRVVANLNMYVYYLKHKERVQRKPASNSINLSLVHSYRDQQRHEVSFKKTAEETVINDKDWPINL